MLRGKRADASEGIILLISIFFIAISFIAVLFINTKFHEIITTTALNESSVAQTLGERLDNINTYGAQRAFMVILTFLIMGMMVSAYLTRVHPIWTFIYLITTGFMIFLGVILANTYAAFINNPTLADIASQQTTMNWAMSHIIQIMLGAVGLSLVILFGKPNDIGV